MRVCVAWVVIHLSNKVNGDAKCIKSASDVCSRVGVQVRGRSGVCASRW